VSIPARPARLADNKKPALFTPVFSCLAFGSETDPHPRHKDSDASIKCVSGDHA
jgi:hypothetical protein